MFGEETLYQPLEPLHSSTEYQPVDVDGSGVLHSDLISEFAIDPASSNIWEQLSFPVSENGGLGGRLGETKQLKFVKLRCSESIEIKEQQKLHD